MSGPWDELWAEAKRADMVALAQRLGARLNKRGIGPCPLGCSREDGFVVSQEKGFLCRQGEARGDAVDMVMHVKGYTDVADALEFITGKRPPRRGDAKPREPTPTPPHPMPPPAAREPAREGGAKSATTTADASRLWRESIDPRGTPVETYLNRDRKLELGADLAGEVLRWNSRIGAMIALFRNIATGEPQAASRTHLDCGAHKLRRAEFTGPAKGSACMLDPFENVLEGLHVGAGIETVMTARQYKAFKPAWALGSDVAIANLPALSGIECLTLIQENDENGSNQRACNACARRWDTAGREVFIDVPKPGFNDINDAIRSKGS